MKLNMQSQANRDSGPRIGTGNWGAFPHDRLPEVLDAAKAWREALSGIERPWLCWCVHDDWCVLQQRLVQSCGWTPIVGTDGRVQNPTVLDGAVFVDFNASLHLPVMWMHFPLEFVFAFCDRLAFWHSDVLPPVPAMRALAAEFGAIEPGEYVGVFESSGTRQQLRRLWKGVRRFEMYRLWNWNARRWFEVVGCTTADASRSQFEHGCGMWRHIERHPNAPERFRRARPHYDHGVGVWYWQSLFGGRTRRLETDVEPYHYVTKGSSRVRSSRGDEDKGTALRRAFALDDLIPTLGLPATSSEESDQGNLG
jgi:hypothetical protein